MTRTTSAEHWLTVSEAARALGLSRTSLLAAEDAGLISPMRTPGGHRRYRPAELRRYLDAAGAGAMPQERAAGGVGAPQNTSDQDPADRTAREVAALDLATTLRAAIRPIVRALDAQCGGLYVHRDAELRFCAAFGVPRWLAERLAMTEPPPALAQAMDGGRPRLFDPAAEAFPEPRSTGHGVAMALPHVDGALGLLFVVLPADRAPLPGELRTLGAFGELLALLVADRARTTDLECKLARVATLTSAWLPPPTMAPP
ncbi:MAG: helix-turn-helix domain-containing protein [Pseudonocardiales bacterium]|nr:helix-turn-helix domain-containing protein [Pseudonocardiales bacterium]